MYIIYHVSLIIVFFGVVTYSQGAGGHGGGGGSSGNVGVGSTHVQNANRNNESCTTNGCQIRNWIIIGVIAGLFLIIVSTVCYCICSRGRPFQKNSSFIKAKTTRNFRQNVFPVSPFQSGIWFSRYFQNRSWHGPYQFSLLFYASSMTVTGSGTDNVGTFTIDGVYSNETNRLALTKTYQVSTGNVFENLGHQVIIQLKWDAQSHQFDGKWYIRTKKYRGEDKFELKFNGKTNEPPLYERIQLS